MIGRLRSSDRSELQPFLDVAERLQVQLREALSEGEATTDLSRREVEVLRGLAEGLANKQIALELGITARTVRNHVSRIYEKLGVSARAEAAVYAVRAGLV